VYWRALAEPGPQYARYLHHSGERRTEGGAWRLSGESNHRAAQGPYRAEWVEPSTGKVLASSTIESEGGTKKLASPLFAVDMALRLRRVAAE